MSKFDKFLEDTSVPENKITTKKRNTQSVNQEIKKAASKSSKTTTTKLSVDSFQLLKIMAFETNEKQIHLLDKSISLYFETLALDNPKLAAQKALQDDYKLPDSEQTTIDEFL